MGIGKVTIFIGLSLPFFMLTVWALVNVTMKRFPGRGEKAIWWIVALVPFIGWLIYLVIGFRRGQKMDPDRLFSD